MKNDNFSFHNEKQLRYGFRHQIIEILIAENSFLRNHLPLPLGLIQKLI